LTLPRSQEIALSEELSAEPSIDADATEEQTLEHQEPNPTADRICSLPAPAPASDPNRSRDALLDRLLTPGGRNRVGQVRVLTQNVANALTSGAPDTDDRDPARPIPCCSAHSQVEDVATEQWMTRQVPDLRRRRR
jgi:hypothetical protein